MQELFEKKKRELEEYDGNVNGVISENQKFKKERIKMKEKI